LRKALRTWLGVDLRRVDHLRAIVVEASLAEGGLWTQLVVAGHTVS
jgi:hypothetical protein